MFVKPFGSSLMLLQCLLFVYVSIYNYLAHNNPLSKSARMYSPQNIADPQKNQTPHDPDYAYAPVKLELLDARLDVLADLLTERGRKVRTVLYTLQRFVHRFPQYRLARLAIERIPRGEPIGRQILADRRYVRRNHRTDRWRQRYVLDHL